MAQYSKNDYARLVASMASVDQKQPAFRGVIYGNSGSGKTVLAAKTLAAIVSAERPGIIHVDTSEGWVSFQNHPDIMDLKVQTIPFTGFNDLRAIAEMVRNGEGIFAKVGGVILDESSTMVQQEVDKNWETRGTDDTPAWPDYIKALSEFRGIITDFSESLGVHVIYLAHEAEKKNRQGAVISVFPSFPPSIAKKVKEPMHVVAHLTAKGSIDMTTGGPKYEREIQVHPTGKVDAKTRIASEYVTFNAEWFPSFVSAWLKRGQAVENAVDTVYQDSPENLTEGMSPEDALETAAKVQSGEIDLDDLIEEISN